MASNNVQYVFILVIFSLIYGIFVYHNDVKRITNEFNSYRAEIHLRMKNCAECKQILDEYESELKEQWEDKMTSK